MSATMTKPKPKREWLPLDLLTFDRRLQFRVFPDGKTYDEATVEAYREARADGAVFPPLEAVHEVIGKKTVTWVFGGFHRGEMLRRDGANSVEVDVYPGTFLDARFWALSQNAGHGRHRSPAECRNAFDALLADPMLLARVIEFGKKNGGTERAVARACGISRGVVSKYVQAAGLRADRITGKLIPADEVSPEAKARAELATELQQQGKTHEEIAAALGVGTSVVALSLRAAREGGLDKKPAEKKPARAPKVEVRPAEDPVLAGAEGALAEFKKAIRTAGKCVEDLLRGRYAGQLRAALKAAGYPTEVHEVTESRPIGMTAKDGPEERIVKVETWGVPAALAAAASSVEAMLYAGQAER
jgi:transposase-like protein